MAASVFSVMEKKLNEQRGFCMEALARGDPSDYAEYRYICGTIRGLDRALEEVDNLAHKYKEPEDD